jgi:hypothetical protein
MFVALQVVTLILVAIATALALAHALELPGKLRLPREQYLAVQSIYYPGFTIGGAAEPLALLFTLVLMLVTPPRSAAFALTGGAFAALGAMHAAYWLLTHPVNRFWLEDVELKGAPARFFAFDPLGRSGGAADWTTLRDRWEFSHVVRAALGIAGLVMLATAIAL